MRDKPGTVYYQVTHRRVIRQLTTDIRLRPEDWDPENECVRPAAKDKNVVQAKIDGGVSVLQDIVRSLDEHGLPYSVTDVIGRYKSAGNDMTVQDFMQDQINRLRNAEQFSTANNYEKALHSFSTFLGGVRLPFPAMTRELIADYNGYLIRRGVVRNTISFYMRILRAIHNRAVRQRVALQTHPFEEVYTGIDRTRKRAVDERVISRLYRLDLQGHAPSLELARDLFIFSYCTRGMAFVDMAYLRKTDIRDGNIIYTRHKTQRQLCIRIEPDIRRIIDRYADASPVYIFPILDTEDPGEAFSQYQLALNGYNRQLSHLSELLSPECEVSLTSYTARHSWATAARNHNVPISVISAGMGHSSERTTRIYLTMLENSAIDAANRMIIGNIK